MQHLGTVNVFAVLVAALAGFVIGGSWYGPLFGKPWMAASGMTKEKGAEGNMALIFGLAFVLNAIIAVGISVMLGGHRGLFSGLHVGLFAGFFGRLANAPIAVLEVQCRSADDARCRFLLGSIDVLGYVHEAMGRGIAYERASASA